MEIRSSDKALLDSLDTVANGDNVSSLIVGRKKEH
jgi:hypothetical protein